MFYPSDEESNRPLPLVAQGAEYAKEKILESREKAAFQKHCPTLSGGIFSWRTWSLERSGRLNSESVNRF